MCPPPHPFPPGFAPRWIRTWTNDDTNKVPYYQPKATHELFVRALERKDIPTGEEDAAAFASEGPTSVRDVAAAPEGSEGESFCYVMNAPLNRGQCDEAQMAGLRGGTAVLEDFVVVG